MQEDVRFFSDPGRRARGRRIYHIRFNPSVLYGLVFDRRSGQVADRWEKYVAALTRRIMGAGLQALSVSSKLDIVFFCRAGRHRSVGMAMLISEALIQNTCWKVQPIEHLAKFKWLIGTCNNCGECQCPVGEAAEIKQRCMDAANQAMPS
jgi:hypothetical protein